MKGIRVIRLLLHQLDFVSRYFNDFPKPDFNFEGHFYEKEFIEHIEFFRSRRSVITGRF
jgi:hypothetical protein